MMLFFQSCFSLLTQRLCFGAAFKILRPEKCFSNKSPSQINGPFCWCFAWISNEGKRTLSSKKMCFFSCRGFFVLQVVLPFHVFFDKKDVSETHQKQTLSVVQHEVIFLFFGIASTLFLEATKDRVV